MNAEYLAEFLVPMIVSNVFVLVLAALCWWRPTAGRIMGGLLFAAAGAFNGYYAFTAPHIYTMYRPLVLLEAYRWVIDTVFPTHGTLFIGAIALGQLAVGLLLLTGGRAARLGAVGAIAFFLGITPLGLGSAFPFPLIAIAGFAALLARTESGGHRFLGHQERVPSEGAGFRGQNSRVRR